MSMIRTTFLHRMVLALAMAFALPLAGAIPYASPAYATEAATFTQAAFEAAQKAGGPILVEVTAPWCPTCKAQKPILSQLFSDPRFAKLRVFNVDFDSQKDVLKTLGVRMQSTLISYKGRTEVARSTGVTSAAEIEGQLGKSI